MMLLHAPIATTLETRAESDGSVRVSGAFRYQSVTTLGRYGGRERREQFASGAFQFDAVDLLSQHTFDRPLASTDSGSLTLRSNEQGLEFEACISPEVAGVSYVRDALALIRSGLAKGLSPGFVVEDETVSEDDAGITRTIRKARLHELSIVTRAAYPQAQVEARNWRPDNPKRPMVSFLP